MTETLSATSTHSTFTWNIRGSYDFSTPNVCYLLHCKLCGEQYVGKTGLASRLRFNNHKRHANTEPRFALSKHMRLDKHTINDISATILESGFRTAIEGTKGIIPYSQVRHVQTGSE